MKTTDHNTKTEVTLVGGKLYRAKLAARAEARDAIQRHILVARRLDPNYSIFLQTQYNQLPEEPESLDDFLRIIARLTGELRRVHGASHEELFGSLEHSANDPHQPE